MPAGGRPTGRTLRLPTWAQHNHHVVGAGTLLCQYRPRRGTPITTSRPTAPPQEHPMNLALAQQILVAAAAHAESIGVRLSISVADDRGNEILTARMDGAPWFTPHIARTKAKTSVALGMDTQDVAGLGQAHPGLLEVIQEQVGHTVTVLGGGVVVKDADGSVLGAVAGSGAHPDEDAAAARAGAAAWTAGNAV